MQQFLRVAIVFSIFLFTTNASAGYITKFNPHEQKELGRYAREAVKAVISKRTPKTPKNISSATLNAENGACIYIFNKGKMVASAYSMSGKLFADIRLAAAKVAYNTKVDDIDNTAIILCILGKPTPSTKPALMYKCDIAKDAFLIDYKGKNFFSGPYTQLTQMKDWRETVIDFASQVKPGLKKAELLALSTTPEFKFKVMTTYSILSATSDSVPYQINGWIPAKKAVTPDSLENSLMLAARWYKENIKPAGNFAEITSLLTGKESANDDLAQHALNAAVIGALALHLEDEELRVVAQRALDYLLIHKYKKVDDFGIIEDDNKGSSLGAAAATLLAINILQADKGNKNITEIKSTLEKFILNMRTKTGEFNAWYPVKSGKGGGSVFPAIAVMGLMSSSAEKYGNLAFSTEKFYRDYFAAKTATGIPGTLAASWHALAAFSTYGIDNDNELSNWGFILATSIAKEVSAKTWDEDNTQNISSRYGLALRVMAEAFYMQKLLKSPSAKQMPKTAKECLDSSKRAQRKLIRLQVGHGTKANLFADPKKASGAFIYSEANATTDLFSMSYSVWGLIKAAQVFNQ